MNNDFLEDFIPDLKTYKMRYYAALNSKICIFTDSSDAEFLAAILANIAVIAEKTPSGLLMSKVSRNQNKCQNSFPKKYVLALWAGPGLKLGPRMY